MMKNGVRTALPGGGMCISTPTLRVPASLQMQGSLNFGAVAVDEAEYFCIRWSKLSTVSVGDPALDALALRSGKTTKAILFMIRPTELRRLTPRAGYFPPSMRSRQ